MKKEVFIVSLIILFTFSLLSVYAAEEHLLPLQGTAKLNNANLDSGNLIVEIYDSPTPGTTGGNLIHNSSTDFYNVISGGKYDILLGNGTQPLSLVFGRKYYMDMYMNGVDLDFNGKERQVFMSTVGNLSMGSPIATTSNDADDALNVTGGGFFGNNLTTNKQLIVKSIESDDALNVSGGAIFAAGIDKVKIDFTPAANMFSVKDMFNVTALGHVVSMGTVTIKNPNQDALNVSEGSAQIGYNDSIKQSHLDIYDGGDNKCGFLTLYDETGIPRYLFVNSTGILYISNTTPSGCDYADPSATVVGRQ